MATNTQHHPQLEIVGTPLGLSSHEARLDLYRSHLDGQMSVDNWAGVGFSHWKVSAAITQVGN